MTSGNHMRRSPDSRAKLDLGLTEASGKRAADHAGPAFAHQSVKMRPALVKGGQKLRIRGVDYAGAVVEKQGATAQKRVEQGRSGAALNRCGAECVGMGKQGVEHRAGLPGGVEDIDEAGWALAGKVEQEPAE